MLVVRAGCEYLLSTGREKPVARREADRFGPVRPLDPVPGWNRFGAPVDSCVSSRRTVVMALRTRARVDELIFCFRESARAAAEHRVFAFRGYV